jgi:hypothetical protein
MDALNDKPITLFGKDPEVTKLVKKTQQILNHPSNGAPPPLENYGPAGLFRNGERIYDKELAKNHWDHIHVRFRPPSGPVVHPRDAE